jgi:uncharacterized RDD family membrane protein YckC
MDHPTRLGPQAKIAGFWQRILAFLIDVVLLGIVAVIAGSVFHDKLIAWGHNGRLLGLAVALAYFGILNSRIGAGATPGQRLVGLKVVGHDGTPIPLALSLARAILLLVPIYLNGWLFALGTVTQLTQMLLNTALSVLVFGFTGANLYLYIANATTRQAVHDLIAGTFVVRADTVGAPVGLRMRSGHLVVISLWFLLFLSGGPLLWLFGQAVNTVVPGPFDYNGMNHIVGATQGTPSVRMIWVVENRTASWTNGKRTVATTLVVVAELDHAATPDEQNSITAELARRALAQSPNALGQQYFKVELRTGFDLGLFNRWNTRSVTDTPANWRKTLGLGADGRPAAKPAPH